MFAIVHLIEHMEFVLFSLYSGQRLFTCLTDSVFTHRKSDHHSCSMTYTVESFVAFHITANRNILTLPGYTLTY